MFYHNNYKLNSILLKMSKCNNSSAELTLNVKSLYKDIVSEQLPFGTECVICYGKLKISHEIMILPCKHGFHRPCLNNSLYRKSECPICRSTNISVSSLSRNTINKIISFILQKSSISPMPILELDEFKKFLPGSFFLVCSIFHKLYNFMNRDFMLTVLAIIYKPHFDWKQFVKSHEDIEIFLIALANHSCHKIPEICTIDDFTKNSKNPYFIKKFVLANRRFFVDYLNTFSCENMSVFTTRGKSSTNVWKIIFTNLHLMEIVKKIAKKAIRKGLFSVKAQLDNSVILAYQFFNPPGHKETQVYLRQNPKYIHVELKYVSDSDSHNVIIIVDSNDSMSSKILENPTNRPRSKSILNRLL